MSVFTWTADFGASKTHEPNVKVVKFGNGYEQRLSFGFNNDPQKWSVRFSARNKTEADQIDNFLKARAAVESFDWTPPDEATAIRVVCRQWARTIDKYNFYTITATFEQVYEP